MDDDGPIEVTVLTGLAEIGAAAWDSCACPGEGRPLDPFTTHRFLSALEESGSVGPGSGWAPRHLAARKGGDLIGVMPLYAKGHSQGEYVFDHNWAHAYENAGGEYYPKLQAAVPFTPATGRRFLARPGVESLAYAALLEGGVRLAAENELSSFHVTFCTEEEYAWGGEAGLLQRTGQQFHWVNDDYEDFAAFLASLSSRKRKMIRKERATAEAFGGTIRALTGDEIEPVHWDYFWRFYQDTGARKWGSPYLTRAFFEIAHETLRDDMVLVLAERDGRPVAGALNFIGRETLYGRYWGALEHHDCLHFEACYYQAIDYAIRNGMRRVEAGAQGQHKLARGYMPVATRSLHWVAEPGFRDAIARYLEAERRAIDEEIEVLTSYGPFRREAVEEQE